MGAAGQTALGTLSLTFRGPFMLYIPLATAGVPAANIWIFAPKCAGHLASVYPGDESKPLPGMFKNGGRYAYILTGPTANGGAISFQWDWYLAGQDNPVLYPENAPAPQPKRPTSKPGSPMSYAQNAYFSIVVPRPKIFYALNLINDTEVVTGDQCHNQFGYRWFTSFRLFYDWPFSQVQLFLPDAPLDPNQAVTPPSASSASYDITPPAGDNSYDPNNPPPGWQPLPVAADIEFQYEGPGSSDPDHQDAGACFDQIMQLAGLPYWLNFQNGNTSGGALVHSGADCLAIPLVIGYGN